MQKLEFTELGILVHHDKMQLKGKGHNSESYNFAKYIIISHAHFYIKILSRMMAPDRRAMVPHVMLLFQSETGGTLQF